MQVEIYKTNIKTKKAANRVVKEIKDNLPNSRVNIDLEDCDNVLRVEAADVNNVKLVNLVKAMGYRCDELS